MSEYEEDFDSPPKKTTTKTVKSTATTLKTAVKNIQPAARMTNAVKEMNNLVNAQPVKAEKQKEEAPQLQAVMNWSDIIAANDTNKHIIFKFMRKGFTSLSAEELACTMVNADFTLDFKTNTREDWVASYQFKVVERLQKCNFNLKWKTKASITTQGQGDMGLFFDLCKTGDIERVVKFLRGAHETTQEVLDATDSTQSKSGLHYATEQGQTQMVEFLLNKGAKVDGRDRLLRTPLHLACLGGHSVIAKLLLEFNADPFERDTSGRTSMHYACCTGSVIAAIELMAVLTSKGQDLVHMKDHTGRTPLHYAVFNQQPDQNKILTRLIQYGANLNALDVDNRTPLHFAAESGKGKVCQLLIQNGSSVGIQDCKKKTPMDLAANDYVREIMIVSNPQQKFNPSQDDLIKLQVDGSKASIRHVVGLPQTDFYEPYEHAQPKKPLKPKINQKPVPEPSQPEAEPVQHFCRCMCTDPSKPTPEMLCMNCRPLGPAGDWEAQKSKELPYNIRNYQAKLVENLRRVQKFGVDSYQHVKKPYMFTGSWMEYVRTLDDLMLQINGCRSNEAVMKVFNILFPYDKPLPRGLGDELSLANFYNDKSADGTDLRDCHPDRLRDNIQSETNNAVTEAVKENRVEDINDLLHLQQQMTALQTANHMAMLNIETKDEKIMQLTQELNELKNKKGPVLLNPDVVKLEEQVFQLKLDHEKAQNQNKDLMLLVEDLKRQLRDQPVRQEVNDDHDKVIQLNQAIQDLQTLLVKEKEKNMQLRMKSGRAFMQALEDPLLGSSSGKIKTALYCPEDDNALMRLMQKLDQLGGASLEQRLLDAGNKTTQMCSQTQFDRMLQQVGMEATDYLPLQRIAGYTEMQGNVKNIKVSTIMTRINDRAGMRKRIEEETMRHIATYINKRPGQTIDTIFDRFETDKDGYIDIDELTLLFKDLDINVNNQLLRILLAIFDHNGDQMISREEFTELLNKYVQKKAITVDDINSNIIGQKDKEDLVQMYNEDIRVKPCYEDYEFDHTDLKVLKKREEQALQLIKDGQMPSEIIKGEIVLNLFNSQNLLEVPNKPYLYVKLKRSTYTELGTKEKQKPLVKICSRYDKQSGAIDQKIPVQAFLNEDKHRQPDTMTLELYMKLDQTANDQQASFIGECFIPYKKCFQEANQWLDYQMILSDEMGRAYTMVTGQLNASVRFVECGHEQSSFNLDGTKKERKAPQADFVLQKDEASQQRRVQKKGSAGVVNCIPRMVVPSASFKFDPAFEYVLRFGFTKSGQSTNTTSMAQIQPDGSLKFFANEKISVNDTLADTDMTAYLMDSTGTQLGTGLVPPEQLTSMYNDPLTKQKPFQLVIMSDQVIGTLTLMFKYQPTVAEAQAEVQPEREEESKEEIQRALMLARGRPEEPVEVVFERGLTMQKGNLVIDEGGVEEDTRGFDDFE